VQDYSRGGLGDEEPPAFGDF